MPIRFAAARSLAALALATLALIATPAWAASESGSHGWSKTVLQLRSGPGAVYAPTGEIPARIAIKVLRCQELWCVVDGANARGWTARDRIAFGKTPDSGFLSGNHPDYPAGGGSVCFFEGRNYTGASFCAGPGQVFNDLALFNLDNRFSSVRLTGSVSAALCRDRKFQSYCERVIESQPVLNQYLVRNLSSARIY